MTDPVAGLVVNYPYLWRRESDDGLEEGQKGNRATCVVVVVPEETGTKLYLVPITSQAPQPGEEDVMVEIPETERRRVHLEKLSWVRIDEVNVDVLEATFNYERNNVRGRFSSMFARTLTSKFLALAKARRIKPVNRIG